MSIAKGEPWGEPTDAAPDLTIRGTDADLAVAVRDAPLGVLVAFVPAPGSDLARAVGLTAGAERRGIALPMDALELTDGTVAVNCVVAGGPPDRLGPWQRCVDMTIRLDDRDPMRVAATTVVVATGQWLRGVDLVPRGHPGDGRAEVQVYRLRRGERRAMRTRLPTGTHLPHPRIESRTATSVDLSAARAVAVEVDGRAASPVAMLHITVRPARYHLLV